MVRWVLVADNDLDVRRALFRALSSDGHSVVCVKNGHEALTYLRSEARRPDVMFIADEMPMMDGAAFRTQQLADPALAAIPVVWLSNKDARLGPTLRKPFTDHDVRMAVRAHCG